MYIENDLCEIYFLHISLQCYDLNTLLRCKICINLCYLFRVTLNLLHTLNSTGKQGVKTTERLVVKTYVRMICMAGFRTSADLL